MRQKGIRVVADYVRRYVQELQALTFEPEKQFETLIEYEDEDGGALVSGAIDIIRRDDPPQVTLIDFKSGEPDSDRRGLDETEMQLQVALYAIAAKRELEYRPEQGLVRYLDGDPGNLELNVPLDPGAVGAAKATVTDTARNIRDRVFKAGPRLVKEGESRCGKCDFLGFCGMNDAVAWKQARKDGW